MRSKAIVPGIALTLTLSIVAGTAQAAASPTEERIGVGVGVTVGALAGGPVGAILGAAIGARLGDSYAGKNEEIETLSASLAGSEARVGELEEAIAARNRDLAVLDSDLRRLRAQSPPELLNLLEAGIEMDLLFRTGEHVLGRDTESRISQLATTLAAMPDVRVQLDGFADARGDESYNRELSARRAQSVRDLLVGSGVSAERIGVTAHGEKPAAGTDADSYALQRKVSLTLYVDGAALTARAR